MDPSSPNDQAKFAQALTLPEVYAWMNTGPDGLSHSEAFERLKIHGRNVLPRVDAGRFPALAANFTHLMAMLLWAGGSIALLAGLPELGVAIWLVNLINGLFSYWQEHKAERAVLALARMLPAQVQVVRGGENSRVLAEELVPGDVVLLAEGDMISADARLVSENRLYVDQSTLTGESRPETRSAEPGNSSEPRNLVFAGTSVASGSGTAVVYATGAETRFGQISALTQSTARELSPLQMEMKDVTRTVTLIAVGVGLVVFLLSIHLTKMSPNEGFVFSLGMIVAFVPEGLLPTVTLALAMGVQRMARRNAIIKRLSVVETLGSATVICTDKTGTLTQNEMTVTDILVGMHKLAVTGTGYEPQGQIEGREPVETDLRQMLVAAGLCNDAKVALRSEKWIAHGDPTEAALLTLAAKAGIDLAAEFSRQPRLFEIPFEARRRYMTTVHQAQDGEVAYTKGSPEYVLASCTKAMIRGTEVPLSDRLRGQILRATDEYASSGLRILGVAMRRLPKGTNRSAEEVEKDLTFLGLAAMMDPPRPGVKDAVEKCHRAGIRIIMITGDYGLTAESIARQTGIVRSSSAVLTGSDLDSMDDDVLKEALKKDLILARVAPEHKLRVVGALQEMGHVVAVTGDGVNDAPALKKAHIGVAMGVVGTDVAREAADVILTDDNFASIVNAVEEGRAVFANIRRFTSYIFTSNAPEAVPFIVHAFSGGHIPLALNIMQILSVDLGTDIVPALALGAEPPEKGIMDRPPRSQDEHIITRGLLARSYLFLGMIQSLAAMSAFYFMFWTGGYWGQLFDLPSSGQLYLAATTMALAAIVTTQIGNLFAQRTESGSILKASISSNPLIWIGIAVELIIIAAIVYAPQLQWIFKTAAFPPANWIFLLSWMPSLLLADEVRKAFLRRRRAKGRTEQPSDA
ncbi:MAG TPA: cation-transporting P-type ATPase [Methanotrichaceae archaeon]|nr:cation-transporting P-type ATPase [Methanotrichaceae archaeon]HQF17249.1 cation-transporting P-type ATPase [Methanotrichaceae archaeon]HQI91822.1 cation-transporting P-type ATPase [Methanotrichaceae archaeon]